MSQTLGWDQSQFDQTLVQYAQRTTRTVEQVINTKLFYIGRRAVWYTKRADKAKIAREVGTIVLMPTPHKRRPDKVVMRRVVYRGSASANGDKTLAMVIIMARRKKKGEKGIGPKEMKRAVRAMLASRQRSIGFLASGWLPGIKMLAPLADKTGMPPMEGQAKVYGQAKGTASPAWGMAASVGVVKGWIQNTVHTKWDPEGKGLQKYAGAALRRAFEEETQSMKDYLERKMVQDILEFNGQQR